MNDLCAEIVTSNLINHVKQVKFVNKIDKN
jgi:hypothetical protein